MAAYCVAHSRAKDRWETLQLHTREIVNAWRYVMHSGCSWPMLPPSFPHWKTVYHYVRLWRIAGILDQVDTRLREQLAENDTDRNARSSL
jgi:transposase